VIAGVAAHDTELAPARLVTRESTARAPGRDPPRR
jgi:hypothetical protein